MTLRSNKTSKYHLKNVQDTNEETPFGRAARTALDAFTNSSWTKVPHAWSHAFGIDTAIVLAILLDGSAQTQHQLKRRGWFHFSEHALFLKTGFSRAKLTRIIRRLVKPGVKKPPASSDFRTCKLGFLIVDHGKRPIRHDGKTIVQTTRFFKFDYERLFVFLDQSVKALGAIKADHGIANKRETNE